VTDGAKDKVIDIVRGAGDGDTKGKRATPVDVSKFMNLAARQSELKEAVVDSALAIALQTARHDKSVAALADLNVEYSTFQVQFGQKYGINGQYVLTPDGLIIEQGA
jgi:hypothetical protein